MMDGIEVWQDEVYESECCECQVHAGYATAMADQPCPSCEEPAVWVPVCITNHEADEHAVCVRETGWWWWSCWPGCLPDSDAFGPFETEALARADAARWT